MVKLHKIKLMFRLIKNKQIQRKIWEE